MVVLISLSKNRNSFLVSSSRIFSNVHVPKTEQSINRPIVTGVRNGNGHDDRVGGGEGQFKQ